MPGIRQGLADLRVPHWMVLAINGSRDAPPIGFIWDDDPTSA